MEQVSKIYIIAEAGVNHNGRLDLAYKLCDEAKHAGVDAVKFQTWKTELIVTEQTSLAAYQIENITNKEESQFEMLKKLELSYPDFISIKKYCEEIGIQFLSTPDEEESLDFLCSLGMPLIKVGSGEVTNIPYLRKIGSKGLPIILSTGMSILGDVELAYQTLQKAGADDITLLHCTTNYPCPMSEVNLRAMITLKHAFKCPVGYSDHTVGIEVPIAAASMGATIIEKHFTLDKTMEGPDHSASIDPSELCEMVRCIRNIEMAMGDGVKKPNHSEEVISTVVRKTIVARRDIHIDEILCEDNLTVKRANEGISPVFWDSVVGEKAAVSYKKDDIIKR